MGLNRRIRFVCVAMCSLVMSLCSCDLLWGAICAKIECDFFGSIFVDLPKIVQIVRDLVNGTLRFSK